jgi:hypothetical protein
MIALRASGLGIYVHPMFETEPPMPPTTRIGQPNGAAVDCHVAIRNIATKVLAHRVESRRWTDFVIIYPKTQPVA